jgi:NADH dehydrogenase (ubiquinone) 1 alpha subcomplex subunit 8
MSAREESAFTHTKFVDPTPLPDSVPKVDELGATSAPLKSASFFIGQYCKDYNDDFMLCKKDNSDPKECLKEGRKVTRCAIDL